MKNDWGFAMFVMFVSCFGIALSIFTVSWALYLWSVMNGVIR